MSPAERTRPGGRAAALGPGWKPVGGIVSRPPAKVKGGRGRKGGAAVLHLSVHAIEQIGVEARDDSELPPPEEEEQAAPQTAPP